MWSSLSRTSLVMLVSYRARQLHNIVNCVWVVDSGVKLYQTLMFNIPWVKWVRAAISYRVSQLDKNLVKYKWGYFGTILQSGMKIFTGYKIKWWYCRQLIGEQDSRFCIRWQDSRDFYLILSQFILNDCIKNNQIE